MHAELLKKVFPELLIQTLDPSLCQGVMLEKSTLEKCFDFCTENPYDFLLITNQPDGRPRVRVNGWRGVRGLL